MSRSANPFVQTGISGAVLSRTNLFELQMNTSFNMAPVARCPDEQTPNLPKLASVTRCPAEQNPNQPKLQIILNLTSVARCQDQIRSYQISNLSEPGISGAVSRKK
jgi:hypothetical protein